VRFLCEVGLNGEAAGSDRVDLDRGAAWPISAPPRLFWRAAVAAALLAGLFLASIGIVMVAITGADPSLLASLGIAVGRNDLWLAASMTYFIPSFGVSMAGLGVLVLLRSETKRLGRRRQDLDAIEQLILLALEQRLQNLVADHGLGKLEADDRVRRLGRAWVLANLAVLNGARKGSLLCGLATAGLLSGAPGLDLAGADLSGASLADAELGCARLAGADLRGAILARARLEEADLRGADLSAADLRGSDLRSARLAGARLDDAQLQRAVLHGADLRRASVQRANFWGANLAGADLAGLLGVPEALPADPSRGSS
jgi:hypothetical protein